MGIDFINVMMITQSERSATSAHYATSAQQETQEWTYRCRVELDTELSEQDFLELHKALEKGHRLAAMAIIINARVRAGKPAFAAMIAAAVTDRTTGKGSRPYSVKQMILDYGPTPPRRFHRASEDSDFTTPPRDLPRAVQDVYWPPDAERATGA